MPSKPTATAAVNAVGPRPGNEAHQAFVADVPEAPKAICQAINDLLGGHLKLLFPSIPSIMQHIKSGRVIPLGVASAKRSSSLPEVPTIAESGLKGYEVSGWYGVIAPPRMAKPLLAKLNGEINRIIAVPETRQIMSQQGADPLGSTPEEFAKAIANDIEKWKKVVAAAGIKPEQ